MQLCLCTLCSHRSVRNHAVSAQACCACLLAALSTHALATLSCHCMDFMQFACGAGLENLQHQYVRYQGQVEAKQADEGWTLAESEATWSKTHGGDASSERFNANGTMPQQVRMCQIVNALALECAMRTQCACSTADIAVHTMAQATAARVCCQSQRTTTCTLPMMAAPRPKHVAHGLRVCCRCSSTSRRRRRSSACP
jgi:hypothetical protein